MAATLFAMGEIEDMISMRFADRRRGLVLTACLVLWISLGMGIGLAAGPKEAMDKLGMVQIEENVAAPDFTVTTVAGDVVKLSSMKGKVVLLNFWATW